MGKIDQIRALGAPQIGRMAEQAGCEPVTEKKTVTELRNDISVTLQKRGRRAKPDTLSNAERQRRHRERKKQGVRSNH